MTLHKAIILHSSCAGSMKTLFFDEIQCLAAPPRLGLQCLASKVLDGADSAVYCLTQESIV